MTLPDGISQVEMGALIGMLIFLKFYHNCHF